MLEGREETGGVKESTTHPAAMASALSRRVTSSVSSRFVSSSSSSSSSDSVASNWYRLRDSFFASALAWARWADRYVDVSPNRRSFKRLEVRTGGEASR